MSLVDWALLTLVHAIPTLLMVGVIWVVQLVHYPLFAFADEADFVAFEAAHRMRIIVVVMPLMLAEVVTAILLVLQAESATQRVLAWTGASLLLAVWLCTFLLQVPLHRRLSRGWDAEAARRLVSTNWLRTALWTLRGVVATVLLLGLRSAVASAVG